MIFRQNQPLLDPTNHKLMAVFLIIFWTGALTLVALALGAFIAVVYLINLFLDAVTELGTHLATLYTHTDSLGKILLWIVGFYIILKLAPWAVRSSRRSYQALRRSLHW